jgi:hypothetical protein
MKQTAVEWLVEQFKEYDFEDSPTMYIMQIPSWVLEKKELQAKEIEKQQQGYSEEEVLKAQQAILCNIKDALMNENYIIEYLNNLKTNKI